MSTALTKTKQTLIKAAISEFKAATEESADALKRAAVAYYKGIIIDASAREMFAEAFPKVSSATWSGFVKIATAQMDERLLFDASPGATALKRCDIDAQRHYCENPVKVAVGDGDHICVHVDKLTSDQVKQVFYRGAVRDLPEQRAWIETQKARAARQKLAIEKEAAKGKAKAKKPAAKKSRVWLSGNPKRFHFSGDGSLSLSEVAAYLEKML